MSVRPDEPSVGHQPPPSWAPPRTPPSGEAALFPVGAALGFLRRLREGVEAGTDPVSAVAGAIGGLPADAQEGLDRAMRRAAGDYSEDEWGFDEEFADAIFPLLEFMYERWWRVQVEGTVERAVARAGADGGEPRGHRARGTRS